MKANTFLVKETVNGDFHLLSGNVKGDIFRSVSGAKLNIRTLSHNERQFTDQYSARQFQEMQNFYLLAV